jgi:uncharacterized repeat protein (TIGR01451 family)
MSDERYDRSADMRLLELQREALGVPRRVIDSISYTDPDPLPDTLGAEPESYAQSGTILIAATDARPRTALIPGALVTISLSVANDGDAAATNVRMSLPLPVDTSFRPGTLTIDGVPGGDDVAAEFFANGIVVGDIGPGTRTAVSVKLVVELGRNDIILSPQLSAAAGAIVGLRAMRLTRDKTVGRGLPVERPFYESDEQEHLVEPLAPATPQPTITVLQPREYPPTIVPAASTEVPSTIFRPVAPIEPKPVSTVLNPVGPAGTTIKPVVPPAAVAKTLAAVTEIVKPVAPVAAVVQPVTPLPAVLKPVVPVASIADLLVPAREAAKPVAPVAAVVKPPTPVAPKPAAPVAATPVGPVVAKPIKTVAQKPVPVAKPLAPSVHAKAVTKHVADEKPPPKPRAKPKPKSKSKAELQVVEALPRPKIEVVRSVDDRISFAAQGGPILAVRIDRRRLATLTGLFSGASLGMIAHYLVLNALAARDPLPGDGTDTSIAAFVASQEQLLSRALITTRLGKTPASDSVGAALPAFPPPLATHADRRGIDTPPPGQAMLFRAFQPSEVSFVQRMLSNESAAPFMRAAQLFIGLCANDVALPDEAERRRVAVALTAYAALATAEISRIFLNAKQSGMPALFKATESSFDDAARTVLNALAGAIA